MMGWSVLGQQLYVRLTGADTANFISYITICGVKLTHVRWVDELTVTAWLPAGQQKQLSDMAEKRGVQLSILKRKGISLLYERLKKRPILSVSILLLCFLSWFVPGRILFVQISGNGAVPASRILEAAEECGVFFGASRRDIRSEQVKNHLLTRLPQLEWVGVNTSGCVAVISVSPRTETGDRESKRIASIVAQRDGVITNCTVTAGTALCAPGQAVKKGDILISAYTDTGLHIRAQQAEGEIFAATNRELTTLFPLDYRKRGAVTRTEQNISLLYGKKRINFYKDSGILPPSCDKMYSESYVVLPGGFQLPLGIAIEKVVYYEQPQPATAVADADDVSVQFSNAYLLSQMISGELLHTQCTAETKEDVYILHTQAACREMIGRQRIEESLNGKNS